VQYCDDKDLCFCYIVEDTIVPDAQPVGGRLAAAQPLDSAPTHAIRLVPQMGLDRIEDRDRIDAAQSGIWAAARGSTSMRNMT